MIYFLIPAMLISLALAGIGVVRSSEEDIPRNKEVAYFFLFSVSALIFILSLSKFMELITS